MRSAPSFTSQPEQAILAERFGHAAGLLLATERKTFRLAALSSFLWPAVRLNQIDFAFNSLGKALAYVTWAFLTEDVAREVQSDPARLLHLSEWNEGDQLWIMDVVAPFGHAPSLLRRTAGTRLAGFARARALRDDGGGARFLDIALPRRRR